MSGSLLFSSSLEGARRRLAVTPLGAKRLTSAGISAAGQVGCDAAMEVGPCISISSLDFAVGVGPALFCSRGEDLGFEAAPSKGYSTDVRKPMIKIQTKELDDQLTLQVEGRLAGAFVPELENCWQAARANQPNRKISVYLKSVTCIDRDGRSLLQLMHRNGVGFLRAGLAIQDILEQVMETPECKH